MAEPNSTGDGNRLTMVLDALRSSDALTQNEGVAGAVRIGAAAVPGLLSLLEERGINRAQVMYALAQIADQRAAQVFVDGLSDHDERVRAYAAQGLARVGDPQALVATLQTLNDAADELHLDITPSVRTLGGMGLKVVPSLLDLLMDEDEMTRLHAQRALELILARRHHFIPGSGYSPPEAEEQMRSEWRANGDYDYSRAAGDRAVSVEKWRQWLTQVEE